MFRKKKKEDENIPSHEELIKLGLDPSNFTQNSNVQIDNNELESMLSKDIEDVQVDMNEDDENDHDLSAELNDLNSNEGDDGLSFHSKNIYYKFQKNKT